MRTLPTIYQDNNFQSASLFISKYSFYNISGFTFPIELTDATVSSVKEGDIRYKVPNSNPNVVYYGKAKVDSPSDDILDTSTWDALTSTQMLENNLIPLENVLLAFTEALCTIISFSDQTVYQLAFEYLVLYYLYEDFKRIETSGKPNLNIASATVGQESVSYDVSITADVSSFFKPYLSNGFGRKYYTLANSEIQGNAFEVIRGYYTTL